MKDVTFNSDAINGETSWNFKNGHLVLQAAGKDLTFKAADKLFATVTLKMTGYADKDTTVNVSADYITADKGTVEYDVKACSLDIKEKYLDTKALAKKLGYSNPLVTTDFGADPYAIVYDGRVYVYMTSDDYEYDAKGNVLNNSFGYIKTLRIISSDDMVNWTDHGEIKVAGNDGAAKWASHSWAPAIAYKQIDGKDKFFLYFANDASGIGVLEADTPLGPWKDPIGKALLTKETPGCKGVEWCFDPAVLVDDDGSAYIYFGGGVPNGQQNNPKTARVAKLGEDMLEMTPVNVRENNSDILHEFELPWKMTLLPKCENEVAVWQKKIEIFKNYFAIPRKGQNEYFYVDVKGLKEYDMISGWLDIYLDSDYVRRCFLNVDKAENLKIDLGSVKGVKINSRKVADEVSSKKLQGKIIRRYKYIFEVTNNLQCTIALRLYDRIPVSQVDGVEVMLNRIDDVVLDEATGKCTWDIKVKPLSVKEIAFEYAITYPAKEKFVIE